MNAPAISAALMSASLRKRPSLVLCSERRVVPKADLYTATKHAIESELAAQGASSRRRQIRPVRFQYGKLTCEFTHATLPVDAPANHFPTDAVINSDRDVRFGSFSSDGQAPAAHGVSASLQKRTRERLPCYVRFVPIATERSAAKKSLLNHLVGAGEQRRWHSNAKPLGGVHIDDQLETSWLLDRQIGGLGAFEDFVDVHGSLAKKVRIYRGVRHQPALVDEPARHGNRRHAVLQRQLGGALARQAGLNDDGVGPVSLHRGESALELLIVANPDRVDCGSSGFAAKLDLFEARFREGVGRVGQSGDPARRRQHVADQLDALAGQFGGYARDAGDISTRSGKAHDQARADRISGLGHHDRDFPRRLLCRHSGGCKPSDDDIDLETNQLSCKFGKPVDLSFRRSKLKSNVLPLDIPQIA